MIPQAYLVLWFLATFLLLWGASLLFRGVAQRWSRERRCPACRARMRAADGLTCPACGARAECVEALVTGAVRWPFILAGAGVMLVSIGVFHAGYVVRAWSAGVGDVYDAPTGAAALGIAAFGLIVCAMGVRGERAKGRRRCPKCWYDMAGAATTCPECGFVAKAARDFYRPRRRWRTATIGLAILLAAYPVYITPRVRAGGWVAAIPTWVLIAGLPWWPDSFVTDSNSSYEEDLTLEGRAMFEGGMWEWESELLHWRARRMLASRPDPGDLARAGRFLHEADSDLSDEIVLSIAEAVVNGTPAQRAALDGCEYFISDTVQDRPYSELDLYVPALIQQLDNPPEIGLGWTTYLLALAGPSADAGLPRLIEMMRAPPRNKDAFAAIMTLRSRLARSPATRAAMILTLTDPDPALRRAAALVLAANREADAVVIDALLPVLDDQDDMAAIAAARALNNQSPQPPEVIEALFRHVESTREDQGNFVPMLKGLDQASVDRYLPRLTALLSDSSASVVQSVMHAIDMLSWAGMDVSPALEPLRRAHFEGDDESTRLWLISKLETIQSERADEDSNAGTDSAR